MLQFQTILIIADTTWVRFATFANNYFNRHKTEAYVEKWNFDSVKQSCSLVSYNLLFQNTPICDLKKINFFNLNI